MRRVVVHSAAAQNCFLNLTANRGDFIFPVRDLLPLLTRRSFPLCLPLPTPAALLSSFTAVKSATVCDASFFGNLFACWNKVAGLGLRMYVGRTSQLVKQFEVDGVCHGSIAGIFRVKMVATVILRRERKRIGGIAGRLIEVDRGVEDA
jgi:hypothetical protein